MNDLPSSARIVVIGGGIGGCSAAYHLARLGVTDVLLLERAGLSSGTTWHSTGNMETYRADPLIFEMVRYAARLYPEVAQESGQEIGWRNVGRVMYTDRDDRWAAMRTLPELGRARGIALELLAPAGVAQRLPIIDSKDLLGGVWIPSDARVNPTDAVMALARAARTRGVIVREHVNVLSLIVRDGAIRAVVTSQGTVACDSVVLAAGLWSGGVLESCGLRLPLHALEHQYLITKPLGIDRNLPLFLSYDDQLYGREEVGGLMVGSLDDHAIALSTDQLPQNFSFSLLSERWPQFEPYMATAMRRFPALRTADIRMLLNGPESFTPDGQMLLGPVPGATGLFAACGFNSNGMALAPAAGRFIAEWIVEGAPSADIAPLDVRRFSAVQSTEAYIRERVTEIPGYHCRLHAEDHDYETARDVRRSPLHAELAAAGARFASVNGWERPLWVAGDATANDWPDGVAAEVRAATDAVLLVDRSTDAKQLLTGAGAQRAAALAGPGPSKPGTVELVALPGAYGQIEALVRRVTWATEEYLLIATPEQETRVGEWLRRTAAPGGVGASEVTTSFAMLELAGPGRVPLLAELLEPERPLATSATAPRTRRIDAIEVRVGEDALSGSTLLLVPCDAAVRVWRRLIVAGRSHGLRVGGNFAQEALRISRGIPAFGREASPARLMREITADPSSAAPPGSPGGSPTPPTHASRVLAAFSSSMPLAGFGSREVILLRDRVVGELTSRVRLPGWPATLALALLNPAEWHGETVELVADGRRWPLVPRTTAWNGTVGDPFRLGPDATPGHSR